MKISNKVLAHDMSYARRRVSLRAIMAIAALVTFVIGGGAFVVISLTATTTPKPGRITVNIQTIQRFPTAAPIQ